MSKTVKELADEFDVSKQAISKLLTKNFRDNHVSKVTTNGSQKLSIDDDGYKIIKAHFNRDKAHQPTHQPTDNQPTTNIGGNVDTNTTNLVDELKKQLQFQQTELENKNIQLNQKDQQITDLHKLLDQSQRLQLMAENKIEKLEAPKATNTILKKEPEKQGQPEPVKKEEPKKKKSFWSRFK